MSLNHLWLNLVCSAFITTEVFAQPLLNADSIPNIAFINLRNQSSFCYTYKFKSSIPYSISGAFKGWVVFPDQEEREGVVVVNKKKTNVKVKARANYQYYYLFKAKKWELMPRGEESNILPVIDRALAIAKFERIAEDNNYDSYQFIPTLSFLDPTLSHKILAFITIQKKTLLPVKIFAQDSTKEILWQIEFSRYNQVKQIKFPFLSTTKVVLSSEKKLSKSETRSITKVLMRRLELLGENFRLNTQNKNTTTLISIELEIPQHNQDYKLLKSLLTAPGNLRIYPQSESVLLLEQPKINEVRILSFEHYPTVEITLDDNSMEKINSYLSISDIQPVFKILLDTTLVGTFNIDKTNFSSKIKLQVLISKNEIMNTTAIIKSEPLIVPLKIISIGGGK